MGSARLEFAEGFAERDFVTLVVTLVEGCLAWEPVAATLLLLPILAARLEIASTVPPVGSPLDTLQTPDNQLSNQKMDNPAAQLAAEAVDLEEPIAAVPPVVTEEQVEHSALVALECLAMTDIPVTDRQPDNRQAIALEPEAELQGQAEVPREQSEGELRRCLQATQAWTKAVYRGPSFCVLRTEELEGIAAAPAEPVAVEALAVLVASLLEEAAVSLGCRLIRTAMKSYCLLAWQLRFALMPSMRQVRCSSVLQAVEVAQALPLPGEPYHRLLLHRRDRHHAQSSRSNIGR